MSHDCQHENARGVSSLHQAMRQRDRSAARSSISTRLRKPTLEYLERLAPSPQVRRRYYLPRSLHRRKASLFPSRPRPVRLPCRRGSTPTRSRRVARAVASLSTLRRIQSLLNPQFQKRDLGNARQMSLPRPLRRRRLEGIREPTPNCGFPTATRMPP